MNTLRNGTTPGSVMPLSNPEMCAHGAGMSTQSSTPRSWTRAINVALYASVACVCSTPFGAPLDPDVKSTAASCSRSVHSSVTGASSEPPVEIFDHERGRDGLHRSLRVVRAELVMQRCCDGAQPPAPPVQQGNLVAVVRLPGDRIAGSHTECAQPSGDTRDPIGQPFGRGARQQLVERRLIPCAAARSVLGRERRFERGCEHGASGSAGQARRDFQPSLAGVAPRSTLVPMKLRWISTVPAPMHSPRISRYTRSTGYSREKP